MKPSRTFETASERVVKLLWRRSEYVLGKENIRMYGWRWCLCAIRSLELDVQNAGLPSFHVQGPQRDVGVLDRIEARDRPARKLVRVPECHSSRC